MKTTGSRRILEIIIVYCVALFQGIVIVTPPSAANLLTSSSYQGLSASQYGALFLPLIIGAIIASAYGGVLARKWSLKGVFLIGICFNAASMALFSGSHFAVAFKEKDFVLLLISMGLLGIGFGSTLTTLNAYVAEFFPSHIPVALTALHALLGTGTALAPLLFQAFTATDFWWLDPLCIALVLIILLIAGWLAGLHVVHTGAGQKSKSLKKYLHPIFWVFVAIGLLYGFNETMFGNWSTIYLHQSRGLSMADANFALSTMWTLVTAGRILIAIASLWLPARWIYLVLPILIVCASFLMPAIETSVESILILGFAGLACSGMLPLTVSFGTMHFNAIKEVASGAIVAAYMIGYGIAAFGIGELVRATNLPLASLYLWAVVPAAATALLTAYITFRKNSKKII